MPIGSIVISSLLFFILEVLLLSFPVIFESNRQGRVCQLGTTDVWAIFVVENILCFIGYLPVSLAFSYQRTEATAEQHSLCLHHKCSRHGQMSLGVDVMTIGYESLGQRFVGFLFSCFFFLIFKVISGFIFENFIVFCSCLYNHFPFIYNEFCFASLISLRYVLLI